MTTPHPDTTWLNQVVADLAYYLDHREWVTSPTSSITGGGAIQAAEDLFAEHLHTDYAVLMPSATYAMHATLKAAGVKPGDEVIVPRLDWCANWAAVESLGATPIPVAVTQDTLTISPKAARQALTSRSKAVIATHTHGVPADIEAITGASGLPVIEDLTGAFGATINGRHVGGIGAAGVLSLGPGKELDCGEGAVVVTNDPSVWEQLITNATHPIRQALNGVTHPAFGQFSIRPHPLTAALALVHLERWNAQQHQNQASAVVTEVKNAGMQPLVGGPERQLATRWIPVRIEDEQYPVGVQLAGFHVRVSGARNLNARGRSSATTDIKLLTPIGRSSAL